MRDSNSTRAYVAIGGNTGNVRAAFAAALCALEAHPSCSSLRASKLYSTAPWGDANQPNFLNAVLEIEWSGTVQNLADTCFALERDAGRQRHHDRRWGPRTLDLDLLLFGNQRSDAEELTFPHPRMHLRRFVLVPLLDICSPSLVPPGWDKSIEKAFKECPDDGDITPVTSALWDSWQSEDSSYEQ